MSCLATDVFRRRTHFTHTSRRKGEKRSIQIQIRDVSNFVRISDVKDYNGPIKGIKL
jgi:hypothetical protein